MVHDTILYSMILYLTSPHHNLYTRHTLTDHEYCPQEMWVFTERFDGDLPANHESPKLSQSI